MSYTHKIVAIAIAMLVPACATTYQTVAVPEKPPM